jgi:hypothetical protein
MAKITIKPIEPLEIAFPNGDVVHAIFNNTALIRYTEEFGDITKIDKEEIEKRPYDFAAKILYCGIKVYDSEVTLDDAKRIVISGGEPLLQEIVSLLIDNFMAVADEESKKKFLAMVREFNQRAVLG